MRYFLELAYFGKAYHGWQRQPNAVSVQEIVENSLSILLQENVEVTGAGRTDAGVHARQIFVHYDSLTKPGANFLFRLNSLLPKDIAAKGIFEVEPRAHARFDAISRSYEYHIVTQKDVFAVDTAFYIKKELNVQMMEAGAGILMEYTNFKCFSKSRTDVRTYDCKIQEVRFEPLPGKLVFHITADRFLRNMVRAIVGTLVDVGLGKTDVEGIHDIIRSGDRSEAGASVPAQGLFLTAIEYPKSIFI